jgi:serine/threonine protein kinase
MGIKEYSLSEYYIQVGKPKLSQGWILYISIWRNHFPQIINSIISYLLTNGHYFKIPINEQIHEMLNQSHLGYSNQGKIIIITPKENTNLSGLLSDLIQFTVDLKGTDVPTAVNIGHLIYTKYGSYENTNQKYIVDPLGNKIEDSDNAPFQLFKWLDWPYIQVEQPKPSTTQKIIFGKYLIKKVIKNDAKGFVIKALYQKNIFTYKTCILKEGKMGMLEDDYCRDIEDRLSWQFQLHNRLSKNIPVPKAIDLFKDNFNSFFSLEFINGISLGTYLGNVYNGNQWFDLSLKEKVDIINILIKIIEIIDALHQEKIIHRDINPENFIINKNKKIWIIDLELAYDSKNKLPYPPFEKGTEGYMSPEQFLVEEPTFEQDYYSVGALILMSLTQFNPYRLNRDNNWILKNNLSFFIDDSELISLITSCFDKNPNARPSLVTISKTLLDYKNRISKNFHLNLKPFPILNKDELKKIITNSLSTLGNPIMANSEGIWISPVSPREKAIGNIRLDRSVFLGIRKGISGILVLLSEAKIAGFDIECFRINWQNNLEYLKNQVNNNDNNISYGFYSGLPGIAFSIDSMIKSSIIVNSEENIKIIKDCFCRMPLSLDISDGLAGYGLALLKCSSRLPKEFVTKQINICIDQILKRQLSNGSWLFGEIDKPLILTGFDHGIAGIIFFLLNHAELFNDNISKRKAILALDYLKSSAIRFQKGVIWPLAIGRKGIHEFSNGDYLILRPFIKAYKMTNDIEYKIIIEKALNTYPKHISSDWLSQEGGLAGLGEVYLDAWLTFNNQEWFNRAEWIANIIMHYIYGEANNTYWIQEIPNYPNPDLLSGNSGIIRFLLRFFSSSEEIKYILDL